MKVLRGTGLEGVMGLRVGDVLENLAGWDQLPNLDRLRREGDFKPLATTIPPQSPVAWSSVITGLDPGGHGIYDFVHREPYSRLPFSSMAETTDAARTLVALAWAATRAGYWIDWARMALRSVDNFLCNWMNLRRAVGELPRVWKMIPMRTEVECGDVEETDGPQRVQRGVAEARSL